MIWNKHYNHGSHATFTASHPSWLNYDDDKLILAYESAKAKERGTELHEWAKKTIDLKIQLPKSEHTLIRYVRDCIKYNMDTEVLLFYSDHFFGTADAICYNERLKILRISDLKTGVTKPKREQLETYAAYFFLEYGGRYNVNPHSIKIVLSIYQNDSIDTWEPDPGVIDFIIDKIKHNDMIINAYLEGGI